MFQKVKGIITRNYNRITAVGVGLSATLLSSPVFASSDLEGVTNAITEVTGEVKVEGVKIIAAALGIGVLFWGAGRLWRAFKGMGR